MVLHNIPPLYSKASQTLILGSFPSVKSREAEFFYGHPQNRFWRVLAGVFSCKVPQTVEQKKKLVLENRLGRNCGVRNYGFCRYEHKKRKTERYCGYN